MAHSWGALVALALALDVPDAVERLVIIDGYAGDSSVPEEVAAAERDRVFDRVRDRPWFEGAVAAFGADLAPSGREVDEQFESCWPLYFANSESDISRAHVARLRRETRWNVDAARAWEPEPPINLLPQVSAIRCPTLVFAGEHDFICGPVWNRPIADAIAGAVYAEIPGVGHMPQYEAPDEFRGVVLDWLTPTPA
jgi:3-oxoadipate enol-lactonase